MTWIASLLASLVGAAFGATAANMFSHRRELRQEVRKALVSAARHGQKFVASQLNLLRVIESGEWRLLQIDMQEGSGSEHFKQWKDAIDQREADRRQANIPVREVVEELRIDSLDLVMLMDRKAGPLCKAIEDLYLSECPDGMEVADYERQILSSLVSGLQEQIKTLWSEFKVDD